MKFSNLSVTVSLLAVLLSDLGWAAAYDGESKLQEHAEKLISEGALLKPIAACGDAIHYVANIGGGYMCGITNGRLLTFRKHNINDVASSYWLPSRRSRIFAYYKGHVYLIGEGHGITIFDVTDPANIQQAGKIEIGLGVYANFDIVEDKLYVVDCRDNFLVIFSLADPGSPQEISRTPLGEPNASNPKSSVTVTDERIYLLADRKLYILDRQSKAILGKLDVASDIGPGGLAVHEPYVYVFGSRELLTIDVSDPEKLKEKSRIKTDWCCRAEMHDGCVVGYGDNGIFVFSLDDATNPTPSKEISRSVSACLIVGKTQDYVLQSNGEISPLQNMTDLGHFGKKQGFRAQNIVVRGSFAYAVGGGELRLFDISRPWAPRQIGKTIDGLSEDVTIAGSYLFTSRGMIDMSNPKHVRQVRRSNRMTAVAIDNGHLFSAKGSSLEIMDANEVLDVNTSDPKVLKRIDCGENIEKVLAHKGVLYLGLRSGILRSCKVEEDLSVTVLDEIQLAKGASCILGDMCEEDDLIYVSLGEMGIVSVDVNDPTDLELYARFNTPGIAERLVVYDAFAYVADGQGGTIIVDMAQQGYEKIAASYPTTDWTRGVGVSGNYVFSCEDDNGIAVYVSNLSELKKKSIVVRASEDEEVILPDAGIKVPADYRESLAVRAESLIADGALLEPVAALGDSCYYAAEIGEDLMCGLTEQRLKIFKTDNIEDVVGSYWLGSIRGGMLEYYSGHVYLAQRNKKLKIFDVRDPADIRLVREMEPSLGHCPKIATRNDKLLFVDSIDGAVVIMSLADPANPKELSRCTLGDRNVSWFDCSFSPSDSRVYIIGRKTREDYILAKVDTSEVYSPILVGLYDLEKGTGGALTVNGNYIYTYNDNEDSFHIHKDSGSGGIEYKGAVKSSHQSWALSLARGTHFTVVGGGAYVYDLSDPLNPKQIRHHFNTIPNDLVVTKSVDYQANPAGQLEPVVGFPHLIDGRGRFDYSADDIMVHEDHLYMFGDRELRVLDISEPLNPQYAGLLTGINGGRRNVLIKGNYIFTGTDVIDINEPSNPKLVNVRGPRCPGGIIIDGSHLFGISGNNIHVWNIDEPAQAKFIKEIPLEDKPDAMFYHNDVMYLNFPKAGLFYYRLEDEMSLTMLGQIEFADSQLLSIRDYFWQDDLLFLAVSDFGIISLDMQDPLAPKERSRFEGKYIKGISAVDSLVYAVGNRATYLIDMTEEGSGKKIASYPAVHVFYSIAVSGNYVYSCDDEGGLIVFVSNPAVQVGVKD